MAAAIIRSKLRLPPSRRGMSLFFWSAPTRFSIHGGTTSFALASQHRFPAIYRFREYAIARDLMSYGTSIAEMYRQVGIYVGRILKGEKPDDLPVVQVTKFEFVINLKTAKSLGIKVSDNLLSIADEVID
jgi:ABC-type uncharacterized transport system substrate-binding protein